MNDAKYIGLDVHQATISVAVRDSAGKLVLEAILETKSEAILQFLRGLRGSLHVTLEEGTWAAWLHDLLLPHVTRVVVCDSGPAEILEVNHHGHTTSVRSTPMLGGFISLGPRNSRRYLGCFQIHYSIVSSSGLWIPEAALFLLV